MAMVSDWLSQRITDVWNRRPKGMRQKDIEAKVGIGRNAFHAWRDQGRDPRVMPPLDKLEKFMELVGGQFILELVPPGEDKRELVPLDPATTQLARAALELSPEQRSWLLRLARIYHRLERYEPMLHTMVTQTEDRLNDEAGA